MTSASREQVYPELCRQGPSSNSNNSSTVPPSSSRAGSNTNNVDNNAAAGGTSAGSSGNNDTGNTRAEAVRGRAGSLRQRAARSGSGSGGGGAEARSVVEERVGLAQPQNRLGVDVLLDAAAGAVQKNPEVMTAALKVP